MVDPRWRTSSPGRAVAAPVPTTVIFCFLFSSSSFSLTAHAAGGAKPIAFGSPNKPLKRSSPAGRGGRSGPWVLVFAASTRVFFSAFLPRGICTTRSSVSALKRERSEVSGWGRGRSTSPFIVPPPTHRSRVDLEGLIREKGRMSSLEMLRCDSDRFNLDCPPLCGCLPLPP